METFNIPGETDIKQWIKDAVKECFVELQEKITKSKQDDERLLSKNEIASIFGISLVTVTEWTKRGLPSMKQRGRIYYMRSDVIRYLKENNAGPFKGSKRFSEKENKMRLSEE